MTARTITSFDGFKVYKGVKWKVDKNNCYIKSYPKRPENGKWSYKLYEKTWKNYCPCCEATGKLEGIGTGHGEFGLEGGLRCTECDADFCGVSGLDTKPSRKRLKKGSITSGTTSSAKNDTTDNKINNISNVKKQMKLERTYSDILLHKPIDVVDMVKMDIIGGKMLVVSSVTIDKEGYHASLTDNLGSLLTEEYTEPSKTSGASDVASDTSGKTTMQTYFMRKGAELKTANACYKWLKSRGTGGFQYSGYTNHKKSGEIYEWSEESAKWCKKNLLFNCVDSSWILAYMFLGAGLKKVKIHHGYTCGGVGHFWVLWNGKAYDPTSSCRKGTKGKGTFITLS